MADADADQCRALTADGERCTRPAQEDGFCFQHDEDDPTVDEEGDGTGAEGSDGDASATDDETDMTDETANENDDEAENGDEESDESTADGSPSGSDDGEVGLIEVRDTVRSNAGQLIGHPFDALVEIEPRDGGEDDEDGWRAVVEVVERKAVPDTQDILGRYEIDLDARGRFQSYRRIRRLHRGDTGESEL